MIFHSIIDIHPFYDIYHIIILFYLEHCLCRLTWAMTHNAELSIAEYGTMLILHKHVGVQHLL